MISALSVVLLDGGLLLACCSAKWLAFPGTRPFQNIGNSCYLNATLQALFAVPSVQRVLEEQFGFYDLDEELNHDMLLAMTFADAKWDQEGGAPMEPGCLLERFITLSSAMQRSSSRSCWT